MVRISREKSPNSEVVVKVEGQLIDEWVALVEEECAAAGRNGTPVALDLRHVTYVDGRGLSMLRSLVSRSVRMLNVTPLLQDQLNEKGDK